MLICFVCYRKKETVVASGKERKITGEFLLWHVFPTGQSCTGKNPFSFSWGN